MPAVPFIAAAAPSIFNAVGKVVSDKSAQSIHDKQIGTAQGIAKDNFQRVLDWQQGLPIQGLVDAAMAPQQNVLDAVSSINELISPEILAQFGPLAQMLQTNFQNAFHEANFTPQGVLEGQFQQIARDEEAGNRNLQNIARERGVDPRILSVGSPVARQASAARSDAIRGADEMKYNRRNAALGNLQNFFSMVGVGKRRNAKERQHQVQTGPGDVRAALSAYQLGRPPEQDIIV